MPEIRYYTVTQTREVEVTANSETDAFLIATAAFEFGQHSDNGVKLTEETKPRLKDIWGNTTKRIKTVSASITRH